MTAPVASSRRRGQPLIVMAAIAAGWIGLRAAMWEPPFVDHAARAVPGGRVSESPAHRVPSSGPVLPATRSESFTGPALVSMMAARHGGPTALVPRVDMPALPGVGGVMTVGPAQERLAAGPAEDGRVDTEGSRPANDPRHQPAATPDPRRWHIDGWYAWRHASGQPRVAVGGPRPPAYGGTQGGFVLRYDLGGDGGARPQVYLRVTHAPVRPAQADAAAGFGLRPLARIPIRLQGEARVTRTEGWTEVRPAVAAITEVPPARFALGFRGEAYAQAGFVGGREATGFVDGQVRVDRAFASLGNTELRLGVGAWGGAQKYAARLDVGPGLTLDLHRAGLPARLSLDYRVRVAGRARPSNGPAVTLSTGF